jgi:hypothetical protein
MITDVCFLRLFVVAGALLLCEVSAAKEKPTNYCNDVAIQVLKDPTLLVVAITPNDPIIQITNDPTCFFQASLSNPSANQAIAPVRTSLIDGFESLSPGQQQGSNLSSSGSTNAVSKPAGPTSLVEEFGGANVTRGTSSSTVQWSPGTMLTNLALTGVEYECILNGQASPCISPALLRDLAPLTFKITANTSSGTPSMSGMAANTSSTSTSQQVTVNSQGNSGPSFAGLTAQYSFLRSRDKAGVKSLTSQSTSTGKPGATSATQSAAVKYFGAEIKEAWKANKALDTCKAYNDWKDGARTRLTAKVGSAAVPSPSITQAADVQGAIESEYQDLQKGMLKDDSCRPALKAFQGFYASILEAKTYEDFAAVQASSATPELALEYDLNTPQSKPSYSSFKATANWQFGKSTPAPPSPTDPKTEKLTQAQTAIRAFAQNQAGKLDQPDPKKPATTGNQSSTSAKALAQANAQPWSITLTGTADVYNSEPPNSVPSGTHLKDIQAGAEIAYVFSPFGKNSTLGSFLGSATAAAAYSYQDQTSPAILTGPALTDFTGLPTSTKTVYAQRGVIHLGQIRLGFGTGKNLTYPLAFTYSNRTELITHPTWGLQFGITYNLTSLFNSSGTTKSGTASGSN